MKLKIFYDKNVYENAAYYYDESKKEREKMAGVKEAIEQTEKELKKTAAKEKGNTVKIKRERQWFEKFHHTVTTSGKMMIGGRNAQQNDFLYSKHFEADDLFFHADIQGGAATILKGGAREDTDEKDRFETAQFAACFSNAWKNANAAVDVYAAKKEQVTKNMSGGFIPSGAFGIIGERIWFKNTKLELKIGLNKDDGKIFLIPSASEKTLESALLLIPSLSGKDKGALAKSLAKRFGLHIDELLELLPNGKSKTKEIVRQ